MNIPIAAVGGALSGVILQSGFHGKSPLQMGQEGNWKGAAEGMLLNYTGIRPDGVIDFGAAKGLMGAIAGIIVHMVASRLGINRALGRAKIPLLRI